jgi:hypothetical protein
MSADDGKVLANLPIGAGVDATKFDGKNVFASTRDGKLVVAGVAFSSHLITTITSGLPVIQPEPRFR